MRGRSRKVERRERRDERRGRGQGAKQRRKGFKGMDAEGCDRRRKQFAFYRDS